MQCRIIFFRKKYANNTGGYILERNIIHLKDCIEGMKELDDGSIDAIITSPPYNLNIKYGLYSDNKPKDDYLDWL